MVTTPAQDPAALRAEHDALAARLEIRRSIDHVRRGAYVGFAALIGIGLAVKLGWDRWGTPAPGVARKIPTGPPVFFYLAVVLAAVLAALALREALRARRLMRDEDALFSRLLALRGMLGLDH
ncbi:MULTISPECIES: hypothetical protein [unclassified Anaeromyxobacter]|uniref:hypothetical protein n=1 Tax=unclassified Anaeromyxobacter TaxID=2620896 RepID=UPI001F586B2C|nr:MULTISPECIES: hypothetical protein [unclassified Anaeromyxobacter]